MPRWNGAATQKSLFRSGGMSATRSTGKARSRRAGTMGAGRAGGCSKWR
jgi:hypothetical protein